MIPCSEHHPASSPFSVFSVMLAFCLWSGLERELHAAPAECPRPVSATCFQQYVFDIEGEPFAPPEFPDIHFAVYNSTYVYNVEAQDTLVPPKACQGSSCPKEEVNGFTLFGDFTSLQLRYSPAPNVQLYGGIFFAIPFGGEDTVDLVRPIFTIDYQPSDGVNFIAGTLQSRHLFLDAVFDDLVYFVRPVEQGFQLLIDSRYYQQDLFINWQQQNTRVTNERFDVGYVGKLKFGPLRLNTQIHFDHLGGEIPFPDTRPIVTRNNTAWAIGPALEFSPFRYLPFVSWWRVVGASFTFLGSRDDPDTRPPELTTEGHAHELRGWVEMFGTRLEAARWKGDNFVTSLGDRFYGVPEMTEVSLATLVPIAPEVFLELGAVLRFIDSNSNSDPVSVGYAAVHWNMDFDLGPLFKQVS